MVVVVVQLGLLRVALLGYHCLAFASLVGSSPHLQKQSHRRTEFDASDSMEQNVRLATLPADAIGVILRFFGRRAHL